MRDLFQAYRTFFGKGDALYQLFSPYRICPLGAHVDHQHGLVTGFAFDSGIEFLFSATETGKVEMASLSFEGLMTFNVQRPVDEKQQNWGDYLRGAVWALQQDYQLKQGVRGMVADVFTEGADDVADFLIENLMPRAQVLMRSALEDINQVGTSEQSATHDHSLTVKL